MRQLHILNYSFLELFIPLIIFWSNGIVSEEKTTCARKNHYLKFGGYSKIDILLRI